ncbi:MAG: hypothetical protein ACI9OI_000791 [Chitinophagales bacterium]|jgi:hypothetical protein
MTPVQFVNPATLIYHFSTITAVNADKISRHIQIIADTAWPLDQVSTTAFARLDMNRVLKTLSVL